MIRIRNLAAACGLALGMLSIDVLVTPSVVQAAEQFSAAVGKPLKAAQDAIKGKQWNVALDRLKEAQAVANKKPHEQYAIDQLLAYVLYTQKNYAQAAAAYERMIESGQMPAAEVPERTKAVAQMYFQLKDYDKSIKWAKSSLEKNPNQQDVQVILAQAHYLKKDYKSAIDTMSKVVSATERAGQTPKEDYLRVIQASQLELGNKDGAADVLKKLVRYHQKPEDWDALLDIYSKKDHSDRVQLGYYRLMLDANVLKRPADYVETAQLAMDAQVPAEAQAVVEKGIASGTLASTDKATQGKYDRLLEGTKKRVAENKAQLTQLTKEAGTAPQGQSDVLLGQMYMSYGQYDEAIGAIQRGLKKGGVTDPDEAQVSLGLAYMRKGQKDQARQAFRAVKKDSQWADLAELWALRV
jgi:tetratricopeptide (TPR) repeat protein